MGILTDLIVAPLSAAAAVLTTDSRGRQWRWEDVKGLGYESLAVIHCILDGEDPRKPEVPEQWSTNPFTKVRVRVTVFHRYLKAFEPLDLEDHEGERLVIRTPPALVQALASLGPDGVAELVNKWVVDHNADEGALRFSPLSADAAGHYVTVIVSLAKLAQANGDELFIWMCP